MFLLPDHQQKYDLKVSFAGASLITSFFLARRGKAFLLPGQDLELAVTDGDGDGSDDHGDYGDDGHGHGDYGYWWFKVIIDDGHSQSDLTQLFQFGEVLNNLLASTQVLADQAEVSVTRIWQ